MSSFDSISNSSISDKFCITNWFFLSSYPIKTGDEYLNMFEIESKNIDTIYKRLLSLFTITIHYFSLIYSYTFCKVSLNYLLMDLFTFPLLICFIYLHSVLFICLEMTNINYTSNSKWISKRKVEKMLFGYAIWRSKALLNPNIIHKFGNIIFRRLIFNPIIYED